jgi:hypothetical protein
MKLLERRNPFKPIAADPIPSKMSAAFRHSPNNRGPGRGLRHAPDALFVGRQRRETTIERVVFLPILGEESIVIVFRFQ